MVQGEAIYLVGLKYNRGISNAIRFSKYSNFPYYNIAAAVYVKLTVRQ